MIELPQLLFSVSFLPGEIIISLDVDLIGAAQTSDSSLLLLYFPPVAVLRVVPGCKKARLDASVRFCFRSHVPIILSRTWVTWLQNASSTKKAPNLQIFPFFVSPNRTIIHYNKRAICICILLSFFVKASVRRNKRKRHRRNAVRRLEIHATPSLAEPA